MTHPIVEAVAAMLPKRSCAKDEAREIVELVLRLERDPSVAVQDAVFDARTDPDCTTLSIYRAGIDALLREVEG